jgi:uncharacterized membrane protein
MVLYFLILLSFLYAQVDYATEIQLVFTNSCTSCHQYGNTSGGLNLTSYSGVMTSSNSGTSVVPGDHANSLLWQRVNDGSMPGSNQPDLTADEINLIAQWIEPSFTRCHSKLLAWSPGTTEVPLLLLVMTPE